MQSSSSQTVSAAKRQQVEQELPDAATVATLVAPVRAFSTAPRFSALRDIFFRLAHRPPQVLLLEGGGPHERMSAAHFWAVLLNCEGKESAPGHDEPSVPCLACPTCLRIITHLHRDMYFLDGAAASIKIDDVRDVRQVLGEPPREAQQRVVVFHEAQAFVEAAANALLKSLEEPREKTSFLLLAPQRERLLPTLVSRSMVLALPWPQAEESVRQCREEMQEWETALRLFLQSGQGLFAKTGSKGMVTPAVVHGVVTLCRHALRERLQSLGGAQVTADLGFFDTVVPSRVRMIDEVLAECQESLTYGVNPALVLEWLATRLYLLGVAKK